MATGGGPTLGTSSRHLTITEEKAYYLKYIALLNDGGRLVLLHRATLLAPNNDLVGHINKEKATITSIKQLFDSQRDQLYPQTGTADPNTFDVTLLTLLLRSVCGLNTKSPVWNPNKPLPPSDVSVEADIARLRNERNAVSN